ncbi:MAG: nitroreductase/quinone reductase family protein [Jatrophihabitans sp.]
MTERVTLSGRGANFFSKRMPGLVNWYSRRQAEQFEKSDGRKGAKLGGKPIFRLIVLGRKSGEPHSLMLMLVRRGDDLLVCGSKGGSPQAPNWWKNLVAAGQASVQVGGEKYDVDARVVTEEAERAQAWSLLTAAYPDFASYQALTERVLPIAVLSRRA